MIWGGEAAGAVCAVNPLLEPGHTIEILKTVRARALVTDCASYALGPAGKNNSNSKRCCAYAVHCTACCAPKCVHASRKL
jgi:hypothetical protein